MWKAREKCTLRPAALAFIDAREELRARTRASVHLLLVCLAVCSFYLFGFSPVTTRGEPARSSSATLSRRVSRCVHHEHQRRVAPRALAQSGAVPRPGHDATADKDASHRLYATAPFARMRFFHRLAPSICHDFRPFPSRGTARVLRTLGPRRRRNVPAL